jgi:hypothetical protein
MIMKSIILAALILVCGLTACGQKQTADSLFGDWTGESKCVGTNPSCHDEIVLYHLTRSKNDSSKINLSADKIVDGKPEFMGEFDMTFDPEKMTLTAEFTIKRTGGKGVWLFTVKGEKMDGTLTVLPENEIGRRVSVAKKKADK